MKQIPLTQGLVAIVDDEDYERVNRYKWHAMRIGKWLYAAKETPTVYMHRFILGDQNGEATDHINGNGLDNRRANLRPCSVAENARNQKRRANNTSGYKGVGWDCHWGKWKATVCHNRRQYTLGYFDDIEDAARAYDAKARELFGEFAALNCPDEFIL